MKLTASGYAPAGRLRQRIDLQAPVESIGASSGEVLRSWNTVAAGVPAAIEPLSGREYFGMQQATAVADSRITIRWMAGVTSKMRVQYGERQFEIVAPPRNVDERNRTIELTCREVERP